MPALQCLLPWQESMHTAWSVAAMPTSSSSFVHGWMPWKNPRTWRPLIEQRAPSQLPLTCRKPDGKASTSSAWVSCQKYAIVMFHVVVIMLFSGLPCPHESFSDIKSWLRGETLETMVGGATPIACCPTILCYIPKSTPLALIYWDLHKETESPARYPPGPRRLAPWGWL